MEKEKYNQIRRPSRILVIFSLLLALLAVSALSACEELPNDEDLETETAAAPFGSAVRSFTVYDETATVYEETRTLNGGTESLRGWTLPGGDVCVMGSLETSAATSASQTLWQVETGQKTLQIRYYDGTQWYIDTLRAGIYPSGYAYFLTGDDFYWMCYTPQSWELLSNGCRQVLSDKRGWLKAELTEDGWNISLVAPALSSGCSVDFLCLTASQPLVNWEKTNTENLWATYCNNSTGRWCYDGYYYPTPDSYTPSGTDVYYHQPSAYLCKSFAYQSNASRGARDLAICMADTLILNQNENGYFPTQPVSQWLSESYGIGAGFYDTRFNSDFMEVLVYLYDLNGSPEYLEAMTTYCAFYASFAESYHSATKNGGWLVADYWQADMTSTPHTSLNHQLAEAKVLYEMVELLQRDDLTALADKLVQAVRDTGLNWVKEDGDLYYSVRNGVYSGTDYPYLTYNDLYAMQTLLEERTGSRDSVLDALMNNKKKWMDANGVTGYKK